MNALFAPRTLYPQKRASSFVSIENRHPYFGCIPALTTQHHKERAIGPAFMRHLGLPVIVSDSVDTDTLGTFTGEIPRKGSMIDAATHKARLACSVTGRRLGIGSEGSFGPHPSLMFVPGDVEVIVLYDRELDITIVEGIISVRTNFAHIDLEPGLDIESFLKQVDFPRHALVAGLAKNWASGPLFKGLRDAQALATALADLERRAPGEIIRLTTDMRAHLNPTRMSVIRAAATRLARRIATLCPRCGMPGFGKVDVERGLPCSDCEMPTTLVKNVVLGCQCCSVRKAIPATNASHTNPGNCPRCNP